MNYLLAVTVLAGLLTTAAHAQPAACKAQASERDARAACEKSAAKARARGSRAGISRADAERNSRAMGRNVLQSIEDQVRRQRLGN